ncbi:hypothetical protein GCM10012280_63610 [Wenjunlia tyrosinilytica]|uniref:Uncharacterized protein n=1 Tax=Wenjunlia tyrosinilytica TaxID=1544741 RepID=A0A918E285_9ACTN|nr:hypothetical protein GCM10012280_63610 [Wenjunlia tyrosinilytica]
MATLRYRSKKGAPEKAVADHIKKAYAHPGTTKPVNSKKHVPGADLKYPLHLLYHDEKRRDDNRKEAIKVCKKYWGSNCPQGGKECDEFPFAVTYEGCAQHAYEPSAPKDTSRRCPWPARTTVPQGHFSRASTARPGSSTGRTTTPSS